MDAMELPQHARELVTAAVVHGLSCFHDMAEKDSLRPSGSGRGNGRTTGLQEPKVREYFSPASPAGVSFPIGIEKVDTGSPSRQFDKMSESAHTCFLFLRTHHPESHRSSVAWRLSI